MLAKTPHFMKRSERPAALCNHPQVRRMTSGIPARAKMLSRTEADRHFSPKNRTIISWLVITNKPKAGIDRKATADKALDHDFQSTSVLPLNLLKPDIATTRNGPVIKSREFS